MPDFNAPAQLMGQQLANYLNNAAQDARAQAYLANEQRVRMAQNFEVKANLAHKLMTTDPVMALDLMNDGLSSFGVKFTMEQFNPGMKVLETIAESQQKGEDPQIAIGLLRAAKERGIFVNLNDMRRAAAMEQDATANLSQQQAGVAVALQHPDLSQAQTRVNTYRGWQQGQVDQAELNRMYGTQDTTEQLQQFARDEAAVQAFEADTGLKHDLARAFTLNPGLGQKALAEGVGVVMDPEKRGKVMIANLLNKATRTSDEERQLTALAASYGSPALQEALNIKTAAREAQQLRQDLDETTNRSDSLAKVLGLLKTADKSLEDQIQSRALVHPLEGTVPTAEADKIEDQHRIYDDRLQTEKKIFEQHVDPKSGLPEFAQQTSSIKSYAIQQVELNRERADDLAKQLVSALPGQKEGLKRRKIEALRVVESSEALVRLLDAESPYAIAQEEARIQTLSESVERDKAEKSLALLKKDRERDMATVGAEQERLLQRKRTLSLDMQKADLEAALQRRINDAAKTVDEARQNGMPTADALKEALVQYDVPLDRLYKSVKDMGALHLIDAVNVFAMLPKEQQTLQNAGRLGKKYGVSAKEIYESSKEVNQPSHTLDAKDMQQMYTSVINTAAKISGETGMRFSTDSTGVAQFEMGTIKDPKKLAEQMVLLAETQTFLPDVVRTALLETSKRLGATPTAAPASTPLTPNPEQSIRQKLGLAPLP